MAWSKGNGATAAAGTYCSHTDTVGDDEGACASGHDADGTVGTGIVNFYVGDDDAGTGGVTEPDASQATPIGGIIPGGDAKTVRFLVSVDAS